MGLFGNGKPKIRYEETDIVPDCPHCGKPLNTVRRMRDGRIAAAIAYACGQCNKLLGFGYDRGI